ncbi:thioesterase family protein [Actinomadura sp. DC4]|uniref:thioesterase family protein n=1 Tax=Actinomadura sp. DC4 TaxID=3055069 RepID=UPI0025AFE07C|nr:thioesterase family protein [Actinomadura sp. DC4]MDN3351697.1 thioesterase family protein [Actinomadura sp. DC4]
MGSFDEATAVRRIGDGRYSAELDAAYGFEQALNGGYLMAVLARAALDAAGRPHPISTAASFLRVGRPGPAEVHVESRKSGRTADVARVTLVQEDTAVVEAILTTGTLDGDAEPVYSADIDGLPPLGECVPFGSEPESGFAAQVELRYDAATMGWLDGQPTGRPEMRAHFRLREEREPDGVLLALAVDSLPPVVLNTGAYGWAPTVELTWHMRAVPAPGRLSLHGHGRLVSDGWFDEDVEVWDSRGRLVAQSRQIARAGRNRH